MFSKNHKRRVDCKGLVMYDPLRLAIIKVANDNNLSEEVVEKRSGLVKIILRDKNSSNGKMPKVMTIPLNKKVPKKYIKVRSTLSKEKFGRYWFYVGINYPLYLK